MGPQCQQGILNHASTFTLPVLQRFHGQNRGRMHLRQTHFQHHATIPHITPTDCILIATNQLKQVLQQPMQNAMDELQAIKHL